jgi:hypothetical protein
MESESLSFNWPYTESVLSPHSVFIKIYFNTLFLPVCRFSMMSLALKFFKQTVLYLLLVCTTSLILPI